MNELNNEMMALIKKSVAEKEKNDDLMKINMNFIVLAQANSKALKKTDTARYIEGLSQGEFYATATKEVLGDRLEVTPLDYISLYVEKTNEQGGGRVVSFWKKEDAEMLPRVPGAEWNFLNGENILSETVWIPCVIRGKGEDNVYVLSFKSTALKIARKIRDYLATVACPEQANIELAVEETSYSNNTFYQIKVEEFSKNYLADDEGLPQELTIPQEALFNILKTGNAYREEFKGVLKSHDVASLQGERMLNALPVAPASSTATEAEIEAF